MLAILGGSFDPVHEGHLHTAAAIRQQMPGGQLLLMPAARSPLKNTGTADHHRLAMLELALAAYPGLSIDTRELQRPPPSYTVDTLRDLRRECGPVTPLVWVMGSDALAGLSRWKDWRSLPTLAHLLIVDRPGIPPLLDSDVAAWLQSLPSVTSVDQLQYSPQGNVVRLALPPQPYSSTAIRHALQQRRQDSTRPAGLPEPVWQYICHHHLYQSANGHEAQ